MTFYRKFFSILDRIKLRMMTYMVFRFDNFCLYLTLYLFYFTFLTSFFRLFVPISMSFLSIVFFIFLLSFFSLLCFYFVPSFFLLFFLFYVTFFLYVCTIKCFERYTHITSISGIREVAGSGGRALSWRPEGPQFESWLGQVDF